MQQTMTALRKALPSRGLELDFDAKVPTIGPNDVLVEVGYAGICGTDRHIYDWDEWSSSRVPPGIIVGHEFMGRVAAVGDAVTAVSVGDRVSGEGHIGDQSCEHCRTGREHICENLSIIGVDRDGCFAPYLSMPERNIWKLDARISDHVAAIMDPLGNAMHAVTAAEVSGKNVLVTGSGVIGLASVAIARYLGAARVIATDIDDHRLALAEEFGADVTVNSTSADWPELVVDAALGSGPEVLIEMSGHPDALRGGFAALAKGGTAALLGLPASAIPLDLPNDVIFKAARVLGIYGRLIFSTWYALERFLTTSGFDANRLITHILPLEKFEDAFSLLAGHEALKVIFEIDGDRR
ncbi:MAG: L-threonine 3-dehydrogenase [Acidimicrobiales bacterium]